MSNNKTLFQFLSKLIKSFFNLFDIINDKFFYNKKMQYLLLGSIVTLFVAPVIDSIAYDLEIYDNGALTALTTLAFSLFVVVVIISTISSWRNDDGNWTWEHAKANFYLYCYLIADGIEKIIDTEKKNKKIYSIVILLLSGIVIKALPNVSATIRIFIEGIFDTKIFFLRSFEIWANTYYFIPIIAACVVFIFVRKSINNLLVTITNEILSLLGSKVFITNKKVDILVWQQKALSEPLISVRNKQQVDTLLQQIDHQPLKDLISVLKKNKTGRFIQRR